MTSLYIETNDKAAQIDGVGFFIYLDRIHVLAKYSHMDSSHSELTLYIIHLLAHIFFRMYGLLCSLYPRFKWLCICYILWIFKCALVFELVKNLILHVPK